jgi:hypothetical protein
MHPWGEISILTWSRWFAGKREAAFQHEFGFILEGGRTVAEQTTPTTSGRTALLVHNVFFSLKDNSAPARDRLLQACRKYLSRQPGIVYFACGTRAEELQRPVNDLDFDISLHIVFEDQAAHDHYQAASLHLEFIEENKDNWNKVRVFDSLGSSESQDCPPAE